MRKSNMLLAAMAGLVTCTGALAAPITVDGDLADWGLHRNGNANDWKPDTGLVPNKQQYAVEDQTGGAGSRLNPGWGGQNYDAEALYVSLDANYLYLALVTGLAPNTPNNPGANSYGPGDFAIDFLDHGPANSFEFGIETTGANKGKVYKNVVWDYGLWDVNDAYNPANPDRAHPTSIQTGMFAGKGELIYTSTGVNNMGAHKNDLHYFIEAVVPRSAFDGYTGKFDVHWTMNCANDAIQADPYLAANVPEPGTLALLPLGLAGLAALRRRKSA